MSGGTNRYPALAIAAAAFLVRVTPIPNEVSDSPARSATHDAPKPNGYSARPAPAAAGFLSPFAAPLQCFNPLFHHPYQFQYFSIQGKLMHIHAILAVAVLAGFVEFACLCHEAPEAHDD
ncbi:hypothetical protein [Methylobacterium sp. SI9]|uniref:hypothetical protein n=1 Tax=Methylobacterium guangdongense TaxID=3138811 RepID=UPI00313B290B